MSWATTASGAAVDYLSPQADQIEFFDIATSLSRNHRFGGFSPLKIGQHDIEVAILMMQHASDAGYGWHDVVEAGLVGLLHDFPEYIVGDCPTPFKRILSPQFDNVENGILTEMLMKWRLFEVYHDKWNGLLHRCDKLAVHSEAIRFRLDGWKLDAITGMFSEVPRRWVPNDAAQMFTMDVWTEAETRTFLHVAFIKLMVLTGRGELIGPYVKVLSEVPDPAAFLNQYQLPKQLLNGRQFI